MLYKIDLIALICHSCETSMIAHAALVRKDSHDLKLYVGLPVMLQHQSKYVLLKHYQKYGTTIAYFRKGSAYL